jgi:hypothetical protein
VRNNTIIADIIEIFSGDSLKVAINGGYSNNKIFVYGTEVSDFHALNKEYINTLNVCAVQELHRKIERQGDVIGELKDKVNILINYVDMSKIDTLYNEITQLKSRIDMLSNEVTKSNEE